MHSRPQFHGSSPPGGSALYAYSPDRMGTPQIASRPALAKETSRLLAKTKRELPATARDPSAEPNPALLREPPRRPCLSWALARASPSPPSEARPGGCDCFFRAAHGETAARTRATRAGCPPTRTVDTRATAHAPSPARDNPARRSRGIGGLQCGARVAGRPSIRASRGPGGSPTQRAAVKAKETGDGASTGGLRCARRCGTHAPPGAPSGTLPTRHVGEVAFPPRCPTPRKQAAGGTHPAGARLATGGARRGRREREDESAAATAAAAGKERRRGRARARAERGEKRAR